MLKYCIRNIQSLSILVPICFWFSHAYAGALVMDSQNRVTEAPPSDEIKDPPSFTLPKIDKPIKNNIKRAMFTHGIENNEPIDAIVSISQRYGKMYYFTELVGYKGKQIKHRWEYGGKVMGEIAFDVASPRWRVFSSKDISTDLIGIWTVVVTDASGEQLKRNTIMVVD